MIEKRIIFSLRHEECTIEEVASSTTSGLNLKTASAANLHPEIKSYIDRHILPNKDPNFSYLLVSALGAGEIWGPNVNGDYFRTKDLLSTYKTFEVFGYVYTHHQNKDPRKSIGEILLAVWNPRMHRVELLVKVDRAKSPKIAEDIDAGKVWDVSMGCKVKYDICSICNNHAYTREEYCVHLKYYMGKVLPDGRQVYAINPDPRFFDISFVWVGADPTAKTLAKIASVATIEKQSSITKEVPGGIVLSTDAVEIASKMMRNFAGIKAVESDIPDETLDRLSKLHLPSVLTTLLVLGIVLKPEEFQYMYFRSQGVDPEPFRDEGLVISPLLPAPVAKDDLIGEFDQSIAKEFTPLMAERSAFKPYLCPRVIKLSRVGFDKLAKKRIDKRFLSLPVALAAAALYKRYLDQVPKFAAEGLDAVIKRNPWLIPVITAGMVGASWGIGGEGVEKTAANLGGRILIGIPAAYLTSHIIKGLNSDNKVLQFIGNNPLIVSLLGVALTNTSDDWKAIKKALETFKGPDAKVVIEKIASLDTVATEGDDEALVAASGLALISASQGGMTK